MSKFHRAVATLLALNSVSATATEICGLRDAITDSIFLSGFNAASTSGGLGPAASTAAEPAIGITPTVTILEPGVGGSVNAGFQVQGTFTGPVNTGVSVNGLPAYTHNGTYISQPMTLSANATQISVVATTMDGLTAIANRQIAVSGAAPEATLNAKAVAGFAPLPTRFVIESKGAAAIESLSVDFENDGTPDYVGAPSAPIPLSTYSQPGIHTATATVTFTDNHQVILRQSIIAVDLAQTRNDVCSVYAHLRARLAAQDVAGATNALSGDLRTRLSRAFTAVGSRLPEVAEKLGALASGTIGLDSADLLMVREVNGEIKGYPIQFARDANGVWRIEAM